MAIESLAAGLETGRLQLSSSSVGIAQQRGISSDSAARAAEAFRHLAGEITQESVVIALRAGNRLRAAERLTRPDIEVAWTGPAAAGRPIRSNADIVTEMLEGVRDTGEVLLIGYALTADRGSLMERVVSLLVDASRRRSTVTVAFHQDEEKANRENLLKMWDAFVKKPRIFTWDPPKDHPYTKLHAKCLVVDRLDLLVTSANFTFHGPRVESRTWAASERSPGGCGFGAVRPTDRRRRAT